MPENFRYEKMVHEYAEKFGLDPEYVKDNRTQYDYYEMLLVQIQNSLSQEYLLEERLKKNKK